MIRSRYYCRHCRSSHKIGEHCPYKRRYNVSKLNKFRNSGRWQRTREAIRQRDNYLCVVCVVGKFTSVKADVVKELEVHHIIPLSEDMELGHEPKNLVTLCHIHHQMAHAGTIRAWEIRKMMEYPPPIACRKTRNTRHPPLT